MSAPHTHRCMRCREEFDCYSPEVCTAKYDVLPRIAVKKDDGRVEVFDHCAARTTTVDKLERAIRALADALQAEPEVGKPVDFPQVVENALRHSHRRSEP